MDEQYCLTIQNFKGKKRCLKNIYRYHEEQSKILQKLSQDQNIKRNSLLLEKDIWICWTLELLFKMPNRMPMAFKGGTSLSKAFRIIDRFSEDVGITIDYKAFNCDDPFSEGVSKNKIKNISLQLRSMVTQHINTAIIPYFEKIISEQFKENAPRVELDEDGETMYLHYPSVIEQKSGYAGNQNNLSCFVVKTVIASRTL
jgi:predicted nucleotidyltransferase component of viral defense system